MAGVARATEGVVAQMSLKSDTEAAAANIETLAMLVETSPDLNLPVMREAIAAAFRRQAKSLVQLGTLADKMAQKLGVVS